MNLRSVFVFLCSMLLLASACRADDGLDFFGFVDSRGGLRTGDNPYEKDASLAELRLQIGLETHARPVSFYFKTDFIYDDIPEDNDLDLEKGTGFADLRELNLTMSPLDFMDLKVGRQILTWGTGDMLFINDLFPKDWKSFFSGRDIEYLKAPSDAVFASFFFEMANLDVVYVPRFDSDRYIDGDGLSYWNPFLGRRAGRDAVIDPLRRDEWFGDDEISVRVSSNLAGYEFALYGYRGFWKSPEGADPISMRAFFPELAVYGASVRGGMGRGLMNFECGYYDSRMDSAGDDFFIPNDEIRLLAGYEREIIKNFSIAMQYYVEWMQDHEEYLTTVPEGQSPADEDRHVITIRLTRQAMSQNLILSLFAYYSPSDGDAYLRPSADYKVTDAWLVSAGANIFQGGADTFFGQFEKNNNLYMGVRRSF